MKKLQLVDPVIGTGTVISISIALILVIIGQDEVMSLLVGLTAMVVTLQIDSIVRLMESEQRILRTNAIADMLSRDPELENLVRQIVEKYFAVQGNNFGLFVERSIDALSECNNVLAQLERGYLVTEVAGKYSYGKRGVELAKKHVKAVAYEDVESWRTVHLKGVVKANEDAIKRGITIQRIFILTRDSELSATDVLEEHAKAGVQVFVVNPEDLPTTELLESFIIVDDRILVTFFYTRDGSKFRGERISIEPVEVDRAISKFNSILRRTKSFTSNVPEMRITTSG